LFGLAVQGCPNEAVVRPELRDAQVSALALSDALEGLITNGIATDEDREQAYQLVQRMPVESAGDTFGRAAIAGRLVETKGATAIFSTSQSPTSLIVEAESFAMKSRDLDPNFRDGAATRMLGTLWVLAPADMLRHGDSEEGLGLLEGLVKAHPESVANQLRLGEAYVALGDKEPARAPLCKAKDMKSGLRADDQKLLDKLLKDLLPLTCEVDAAPLPPRAAE
jgi:hypothetical protein